MSRISREEVLRIAHLARIRLSPAEAAGLTQDLESILGYVELLGEVDTSQVPPTAHAIPTATPLRADEPSGELDPEQALANAPARHGTAFAVPQVLGDESEG